MPTTAQLKRKAKELREQVTRLEVAAGIPPQVTPDQYVHLMQSLPQSAASWLTGISARQLRDMPTPRNADGTYNAAAVHAWVVESNKPKDEDPLLAGGDSPNLERYRAAKADLAEMEAAERRGQLVELEKFQAWLATRIATPIRRAIELLEIKYGREAAAIITEALTKVEQEAQTHHRLHDSD